MDTKTTNMLKMLRDLQNSDGIKTRTLQIRYGLCKRTIIRYLQTFRDAGYVVLNLSEAANKSGIWKIEMESF